MQKLIYPLRKYFKAVNILCKKHGFDRVDMIPNKGSIVRFELFQIGEEMPFKMWVVHHEHKKRKLVYSRENYKKVVRLIPDSSMEEFIEILKEL